MRPSGYYRMLLMDERKTRKRMKHLRKHLFRLTDPYWICTIRDYLDERKHLKNIEEEIKAITDAAFFRYTKPLSVEDILNDENNGNSTPKPLPRDRDRPEGE